MTQPLNPYLYERLVEYYGDVDIVCAGQRIDWSVEFRVPLEGGEARPVRVKERPGEEYRVRCKKCRDHRARLYINHMWGVWDEETGSNNLWLANCYNEACYSEWENQYYLYECIYEASYVRNPRTRVAILPGTEGSPLRLQEVSPPGPLVRLDVLAKRLPNHPAVTYLSGRGFDPIKLAKIYRVSYCMNSNFRWATDRIIIPIYQQGMLVGWQARYIGDSVNGVPFNKAKVPKFWTLPGMPKRLVSYNIERAVRHKTLILVEGPTDVWNTGRMATGILGKSASFEVRAMIVEGMKQHGSEGLVVVALDPRQDDKEKAKGRPHQIKKLYDELVSPLNGQVIPFEWPGGEECKDDPGSIDRYRFRDLIRHQAGKRGLKAVFTKPA